MFGQAMRPIIRPDGNPKFAMIYTPADPVIKCLEVQQQLEAAQLAYDEGQAVLEHLNAQYDDIISWADMYDTASMEAKKMIVNCLIKRVEVYRDYKLHIDFNIDFEQFSMGMDIVAIAA